MAVHNGAQFQRKVVNKDGMILQLPPVADVSSLLDGQLLNLKEQSATQLFPIGTRLMRGEQVFRYAQNGGGTPAAGAPLQAAAALHAETPDDIVVGAVSAAGTYTVTVTSTANIAAAAGVYNEGYLVVNDVTGEGHLYKIKSQAVLTGTDNAVITLYDPIVVALAVDSQVGLIRNKYKAVVATAAVLTGSPVGVAPFALVANNYFWMHTGGPAPVIAHAAIAVGGQVIVGTTAAKVDPAITDVKALQIIGYALTPGVADTETFVVDLILD